MKFIKAKKAVIVYLLIITLGLLSLIGLGFAYSRSLVTYDVVHVGKAAANLNYSLGTGDKNQATATFIEAPLTTTATFPELWAAEQAANENKTDDTKYTGGRSSNEEKVKLNIANMLLSFKYDEASDTYVYDSEFGSTVGYTEEIIPSWNDLKDNEQAVIILANSNTANDKASLTIENNEELSAAVNLMYHYRPVEIEVLDDSGIATGEVSKTYTTLGYGIIDHVYSNEESDRYRLAMDPNARWENGENVRAADVVFGISHQIPTMYASAASYMLSDFSNIIGISEAYAADKVEDEKRYDIENTVVTDEINDNDINDRDDEFETILYGLTPGTRELFGMDDKFETFATNDEGSAHIRYYDAPITNENILEDTTLDGDINEYKNAEEYSYVDFDLAQGSLSFPTMISSQAYWPINASWFYNTMGMPTISALVNLGSNKETFLSNSGYKIERYDSIYGYSYVKNDYYHDRELVVAKRGAYRYVSEGATKLAMFGTGAASSLDGAEGAKILMDNDKTVKWIKPKFDKPQTKYLNWNLGSDKYATKEQQDNGDISNFMKDPNFRRAMAAVFDRNNYHGLAGYTTTQPTSIYTAAGMYTDDMGNDFIDYAANTEIVYKDGMVDVTPNEEKTKLEYFGTEERVNGLGETGQGDQEALYDYDPNASFEAANYYWNVFLDDMEQLGQTVPDRLDLNYLTVANSEAVDPFVDTMQSGLTAIQNTEYALKSTSGKNVEFDIHVNQQTQSAFWEVYYSTTYDFSRATWGPDYLDVWSFIGIFNSADLSRHLNPTGSWEFWDGSDYTFNDSYPVNSSNPDGEKFYLYGSEANNELARELFNDGVTSLFDGSSNIVGLQAAGYKDESGYSFDGTWTSMNDVAGLLQAAMISEDAEGNNDGKYTEGIVHDKYTDTLWTTDHEVASWLILETLLKDSASVIVGINENGSANPNKLLFETDPILGYETRLFAFDVTKIGRVDSYWNESIEMINHYFNKD